MPPHKKETKMNKHDNLHTLLKTLTDILPYEYNETLTDNETTIVITKENSPSAMYITLDDDVRATGHDDPNRGYYVEYEPTYPSPTDDHIPLATIITALRPHF